MPVQDHVEDEEPAHVKGSKPSSRVHVAAGVSVAALGVALVALHQNSRSVGSEQHLTLYTHPITGAASRLFLAGTVRTISLCNARLQLLPPVLVSGAFRNLKSLNLSSNPLQHLDSGIGHLTSLSKLAITKCQLQELPPAIGNLVNLIDLDVGHNRIAALPDAIGNLTSLKYLNVMSNCITDLPDEIGRLTALYRLGLKGNQLTSLPDTIGRLSNLVELFITDNQLTSLPASTGQLTSLVKLQASFNKLRALPVEMGSLPKLELMRVAVNDITTVPTSFNGLHALSWFSLAGNPVCPTPPAPTHRIEKISMTDIDLGPYLGCGASGDVFKCVWRGREAAVKVFKAEVSPDGRAQDEIDIALFVDHANLTKVIASVDTPQALVKELVLGQTMADKPNFSSLLRCRWAPGLSFRLRYALRVACSVARALRYLHSNGICHGDVYAHNVLADDDGNAVLCDYGAAFLYDSSTSVSWEAMEVRAFGLLLKDLVDRLRADAEPNAKQHLMIMVHSCLHSSPAKRPTFHALCRDLDVLLEQRNVA